MLHNGGGEAQFYRTVKVTEDGKMKSKRVWNEFGTAGGRNDGVQYVAYDLSVVHNERPSTTC